MPIHKEIRENGRILYLVFTDVWTIQDVIDSHAVDWEAMNKSPHKIHSVVHMKSQKVPEGLFSMWRSAPSLHHPKSGYLVIINAPPVIQAIARDQFALADYKGGRFFDAEDECWNFLRQVIADEDRDPDQSAASGANH